MVDVLRYISSLRKGASNVNAHRPKTHPMPMNTQRFKGWLRPLLIIILVAGTLGGLIYTFEHVTGTRVLAQATMPNGVEIMIKQSFNWSGEPFTTGFYYRRAGGPWIWRYYSHEDG